MWTGSNVGPWPAPFGDIAAHNPVMSGCSASFAAYAESFGGRKWSALEITSGLGKPVLGICARAGSSTDSQIDPVNAASTNKERLIICAHFRVIRYARRDYSGTSSPRHSLTLGAALWAFSAAARRGQNSPCCLPGVRTPGLLVRRPSLDHSQVDDSHVKS